MKTLKISTLLILTTFILSSNCYRSDGPKPKKIYKDTIYRWKVKTLRPIKSDLAEEDRFIRISSTIIKIKVRKSVQKLYAYFGDTFKVFRIAIGTDPNGPKVKQGDNKTPEGTYKIVCKNPNSRGYKSLKISYPNENDLKNAKKLGVNPGGDIYIHGLWWDNQDPKTHWKDNWTRGCVALNNQEIDELYQYTDINTEITILP
jgi:murein L,D-transpeptidase YafK